MSVTSQGLEVVTPFVDDALVEYWHDQSLAPLTEFMGLQREALGDHSAGSRSIKEVLSDYSMAAAGLHNRLLDIRHPGNPEAGTPEAQNLIVAKEQHTVGYLLAFVILHQGGLTLGKLSDLYAQAYQKRITAHRGYLEDDFYGDFADYPAILDLLDYRMTHPAGQYAAMVMLGLHGGAANPESPLIEFAEAAENTEHDAKVIPLPAQGRSKQERRTAQVLGRPIIR